MIPLIRWYPCYIVLCRFMSLLNLHRKLPSSAFSSSSYTSLCQTSGCQWRTVQQPGARLRSIPEVFRKYFETIGEWNLHDFGGSLARQGINQNSSLVMFIREHASRANYGPAVTRTTSSCAISQPLYCLQTSPSTHSCPDPQWPWACQSCSSCSPGCKDMFVERVELQIMIQMKLQFIWSWQTLCIHPFCL